MDVFETSFNVNKYREMAVEAIERVLGEGKLPIIVGGTNYYIESILFKSKD